MRSIAQGLFKLYRIDKENNYYVRFVIKLFGFEIEGLDQEEVEANLFNQNAKLGFNFGGGHDDKFNGYDPFTSSGSPYTAKLTEE